jgi:hypothetical protein
VLRSKYYPDGRILEANLKKGFFFTWQSIIAGLQTFEKEPSGEWRMEIRLIYGMIPASSPTGKVFTPKGRLLLTKVDEELPRENFWLVDVENILPIPLSQYDE